MGWFWIWLDRVFISGPHAFARLNRLLPVARSAPETAAREQARKGFEDAAKLMVIANFGALTVLAGFFTWLKPNERRLMELPGYLFAIAAMAAGAAFILSLTEPALRVKVATQILEPAQPNYEDEIAHHLASDNLMEWSVSNLRHVVQWRLVAGAKAFGIAASVALSATALLATVQAISR